MPVGLGRRIVQHRIVVWVDAQFFNDDFLVLYPFVEEALYDVLSEYRRLEVYHLICVCDHAKGEDCFA